MKIGEMIEGWTVLTVRPFKDGKGPEYGTPLRLGRPCRWCGKPVECDAPPPPGPPSRVICHDGSCAACRRRPTPGMTEAETQRMRERSRQAAAETRGALGGAAQYEVGDLYPVASGRRYVVVDVASRKSNRDDVKRNIYTVESRCITCGEHFTQKVGYGNERPKGNCKAHRTPEARAAYRVAQRPVKPLVPPRKCRRGEG